MSRGGATPRTRRARRARRRLAALLALLAPRAAADVMPGPFAVTTALNVPACGLVSPAPGTTSALCAVDAARPSASACAAACLASPACTAYTWHAPGNGVWSLVCVFRTDGAWQPTPSAPPHAAGRKVPPPAWWPTALRACRRCGSAPT